MAQPVRATIRKKKINDRSVMGTGEGLTFCNECPFVDLALGICNANDKKLAYTDINKINVPTWCGNHKKK